MASDVINRETIRDAFTTLLNTALVGTGLPVKAVYGYKVGDFEGQSPVVVVASAGTGRGAAAFDKTGSDVYLDIWIFVLYSDEGDWGEDDAADRLDLIEKEIADVVIDNNSTANWINVDYENRSVVDDVSVGGQAYQRERIPLRFMAINNV
jgi:hypothetical protein